MNEKQLLDLFGVAPQKTSATPSKVKTPKPVFKGTSDTFFQVDRFDLDKGNAIARSLEVSDSAAADFFAAYYRQNPVETGDCCDPKRVQFMNNLIQSSAFSSLKTQTTLNVQLAELAATEAAKSFAAIENEEDDNDDNEGEEDLSATDLQSMVAAAGAVSAAQEQVELAEEVGRVFGLGHDDSAASNTQLNLDRLAETFRTVQNDPGLRRIMNIAGAYRRCAQALQRRKTRHGQDDVIGITQDNELSRLLSSELSLLADPELEDLFFQKFSEASLSCYDLQGVEEVGQGPIVVCIDESSSMLAELSDTSTRIEQAKAFALAMAWIARHQKRECVLVAWAHSEHGRFFKVDKDNQAGLIHWIQEFIGGGTSLDCVCKTVPQVWDSLDLPKGKTDMIIVSDGVVSCSRSLAASFNEWKTAEKVSVVSIVLGGGSLGPVEAISNRVFGVNTFGTGETAIQECLAI